MSNQKDLCRLLFESAQDAILVLQQGQIVDCNLSAARLFGCESPDELMQQSLLQFSPAVQPDGCSSTQLLQTKIDAVLAGERQTFEWAGQTLSQDTFYAQVALNAVCLEQETFIQASLHDITEYKQIEEELHQQRTYLRQILDINPHFLFAKDREGRFTLANKAFAAAYGTTVEELIGKTDADFNPNVEQVARYSHDDLTVIETGQELYVEEEQIINVWGESLWRQTVKRPILDENGEPYQVLGVASDITARKHAEFALKESETRLRTYVEALPDITFIQDEHGQYREVLASKNNPLYEGAETLLKGKYVREVFDKEMADRFLTVIHQTVESGQSQIVEYPLEVDGRVVWFEGRTSPMPAQNDEIRQIIWVARDISKQKQLEHQIKESLERRGRQVQISTEIAQEIASAPALDELFRQIVNSVQQRLGYYHAQIYLLDDEHLVLREGTGDAGQEMKEAGHTIALTAEKSMAVRAARAGEPVLASAVSSETDWFTNPLLPETKSELAVPVKLGPQVLGILDVQSDSVGGLTEEDQLLLAGLCGQIAVAIHYRQLETVRRKTEAELEARLTELNSLQRLMSREGWQAFEASHSAQGYFFDRFETKSLADENLGHDNLRLDLSDIETSVGGGRSVTRPIAVHDEVIGRIGVYDDPDQPLTAEDQALLDAVAEQVAEAMERARLLEQTQKRAVELEAVAEVSTAASSALEVDKLLQMVVDLTKDRFDLYHAHIYLLDEAEDTLVLKAGAGDVGRQMVDQGWRISRNTEHSLVAIALRSGEGVIANDVQAEPDFLPNPLLPDTRSEMAIPMIVGNKTIGVFDVQSDVVGRFTEEDVQIKTALASQVAVALQNAEQYQQTREALEQANTFRQLVEATSQGIGIADMDGSVAYLNQSLMDLLGVESLDTARGQSIARFYAPESQAFVFNELIPQVMEKGAWTGEISFLNVDGRPVPTIQSVFIVRDEAGNPRYLANSVIDITERQKAEAAIAKQAQELQTVAEIATQAGQANDFETLVQIVAERIIAGFDLYHTHIYTLDQKRKTLIFAAGAGKTPCRHLETGYQMNLADLEGLLAQAVDDRQGQIDNDVRKSPGFRPDPNLPDLRSRMAIPLIVSQQVVGVLEVHSDQVDRFTAQDVHIKTILAEQLSVTIENARLFAEQRASAREIEDQAHRLALLNEMGAEFNQVVNVDEVFKIAAAKTNQIIGADRASVAMLNAEGDSFKLYALKGDQGAIPVGATLPVVGTQVGKTVRENRLINHAELEASDFIDNQKLASQGLRSSMSTPLTAAGRALGTLNVASEKQAAFSARDESLLLQIASLLASAIESRRLFEQTQQTLAETETLYDLTGTLNAATTLEEALQVVISPTTGVHYATLTTIEVDQSGAPEWLVLRAQDGDASSPLGSRLYVADSQISELWMNSGNPVLIGDIDAYERLNVEERRNFERIKAKAVVMLPLKLGDSWVGLITINWPLPQDFTEKDHRFYQAVAAQMSVVVNNIHLLEQTRLALAEVEAVQRRYTVQSWDAYRRVSPVKGYEQVGTELKPLEQHRFPAKINEVVAKNQTTIIAPPRPVKLNGTTSQKNDQQPAPVESAQSGLMVPLTVRDEVIGILGLEDGEDVREWTPEEIALVEAIAEQLAQAAESIRLIDETQTRAAREQRVNEIGEKIQAAQSLEEALQIAVKEVGLSLQSRQTTVQLEVE